MQWLHDGVGRLYPKVKELHNMIVKSKKSDKMKKLLFTTLLALFGLTAFAQHETLFGRARVVGGFGAPIIEWGLGNDMNTSVGGGGGVVIDNFFLGGYGMGSVDFNQLIENGDVDQLDIGHGGFWLGFSVPSHKLIHLYGSTRIGWGAINVKFHDPGQNYRDVDKIFALTPEAGLELNVTRWFRAVGTVGYRRVDGVNANSGYSEDAFNGWTAGLTLRFGWFGAYRK